MSCDALRHASRRQRPSPMSHRACGISSRKDKWPTLGWRRMPNTWRARLALPRQSGLWPSGAPPKTPSSTKGARPPCERSRSSERRWRSSAGTSLRLRSIFPWRFGRAARQNRRRKNEKPTRTVSGGFEKRGAMSWQFCESWLVNTPNESHSDRGRRISRRAHRERLRLDPLNRRQRRERRRFGSIKHRSSDQGATRRRSVDHCPVPLFAGEPIDPFRVFCVFRGPTEDVSGWFVDTVSSHVTQWVT
jgi:hypothetical protein